MPMQATTTTPLFSAELTPNRVLGRKAAGVLVALVISLVTLPGILFAPLGGWIIGGLVLANVLAIVAVLQLSLSRGKRSEQVTLWSDQLELVATDAKGARTLRRFNPKAVRLVVQRDFNERTTGMVLKSGKDEIALGEFLSGDDKSSFAKAFGTALRRARA
jgi:uncharacterized membrane protein